MEQINSNLIYEYFEKIGLKEVNDKDAFFKDMQGKYKIDMAQNIDMAMSLRSDTSNGKIYSVKNSDLQTTIDFGGYYFDLYKNFFSWILKYKNLEGKKILDLGCDNGIVTCFLASAYPNAKIIGVDKGKKGIKCAKELAQKLGLKNVEFEVLDAKKVDKFFKSEKFDVILSVRALLEIVKLPKIKSFWSIKELEKSLIVANNVVKCFKSVEKVMEKGAELITFERLSSFEEILNFVKSMRESGLYADMNNMNKLQFCELGDNEQMPVIVFDKVKREELSLNEFMKVYNDAPILNKLTDVEDDFKIELEFDEIGDKELVFGTQIDYQNGAGSERREVWQANGNIICYKYSNIGRRQLVTEGLEKEAIIKEIKNMAGFIGRMGHKVIEYTTLEQRDNKGK